MKKSPLRRVSKKRAAALKLYFAAKNHFLGNYRPCECHGVDNPCVNRATEVHHVRGRSGNYLLDQRYWLAICQMCHAWIHDNAKKARQLGLLR